MRGSVYQLEKPGEFPAYEPPEPAKRLHHSLVITSIWNGETTQVHPSVELCEVVLAAFPMCKSQRGTANAIGGRRSKSDDPERWV